MARAAVPKAAGPVAARVAVLDRVRARRPADKVRSYPSLDGGQPFISRTPPETDRKPPADLGEWCDDRTVATFGGRVRLNAAEQCAFDILTAMRTGDPDVVRQTVAGAGQGLDSLLQHLVAGVLETWRGGAPGCALDVASAAVSASRKLGWDKPPRRRSRGPEPISQLPGKVA